VPISIQVQPSGSSQTAHRFRQNEVSLMLIRCTTCRREFSDKSKACCFCDAPNDNYVPLAGTSTQNTDGSQFATVGCVSVIVVVCLSMMLTDSWNSGPNRNYRGSSGTNSSESEVDACVERGIQYFKDIGSYPTLSQPPNTGRSAEVVARERCNRTTTAFP
jgi:hypothetical protein